MNPKPLSALQQVIGPSKFIWHSVPNTKSSTTNMLLWLNILFIFRIINESFFYQFRNKYHRNLESDMIDWVSKRLYLFISKNCRMSELDQKLRNDFDKIGKPARYGTAGFRDLAVNMPYVSFRVGVFVALLNKTQPSKSLGIVMSASHNKIEDNGIKITNFKGNMLQMKYEEVIEKFVAVKDLQAAVKEFNEYLVAEGNTIFQQCSPSILIGGDTRPSTPELLDLVAKGIQSQGCKALDFKLTTTPQLQYYGKMLAQNLVYLQNNVIKPKNIQKQQIDMEELRPLFWKNFSSYYRNCMSYLKDKSVKSRCIDCANGVGGKIMPYFQEELKDLLDIELINNTTSQNLNKECGADFVKTNFNFPNEYKSKDHNSFLSFDGDADRIVFFTQKENKLQLIDGDREGTIFTEFYKKISEQLKERTEALNKGSAVQFTAPTTPKIGFVQTYYANYSSSEYLLKQYEMEPVYAATGVKHLHHKAEHFDIGVYFEANGHGTVIFSDQFLGKLEALLENKDFLLKADFIKNDQELVKKVSEYYEFVEFYYNACKLANPSVGDAITNLLIFELALSYLKLDYSDTLKLYTDLKSKTSKIAVKSKENVKVTNIEDKVTKPDGLQEDIEKIIKKHDGKKAFLRPSGTQNVLRLHVQADTQQKVQEITKEVSELVSQHPELN